MHSCGENKVSKMKYLSDEKKMEIAELYTEGYLSVGAIADQLGVSARTVHNYKGYQPIAISDDTDNEPKGINRATTTPDNEPKGIYQNNEDENKETGNTLEFIGGTEGNKVESDSPTKDMNICGKCGREIEGTPDKCPDCGNEFDYNTCESCGTKIIGEPESCPNCKAKFYY